MEIQYVDKKIEQNNSQWSTFFSRKKHFFLIQIHFTSVLMRTRSVWQTSALQWRLHSSVGGSGGALNSRFVLHSFSEVNGGVGCENNPRSPPGDKGRLVVPPSCISLMQPNNITHSVHTIYYMCFISTVVCASWIVFYMKKASFSPSLVCILHDREGESQSDQNTISFIWTLCVAVPPFGNKNERENLKE